MSELPTPSSDFFADVRSILADARRAAYTAVNSASSRIPASLNSSAFAERERRVIEQKQNGGDR